VSGAVAAGWGEPGRETRVDAGKLASLATIEASPPAQLTPEQGGVLLAETVRNDHKLAWLVRAAAEGHLDIEAGQGTCTLVRRPRTEEAERRDPWTAAQISAMFGGREWLSLGGYDHSFAQTWRRVGAHLQDWRNSCGLWDPAGDRRCLWVRVAGGLATAAGLVAVVGGGVLSATSGGWLPVVAAGGVVAGAGLAALALGWELRVRTPAGSDLWLRTESFRRYLAESEGQHADAAASRGLLLPYTAWAVAFGQADRWAHAVAQSSVPPTHPSYYLPTSAAHLHSAAAAASREPSSSSGGGGGSSSGGVGGGNGGGGGGSW
jgi:hypothetical protein